MAEGGVRMCLFSATVVAAACCVLCGYRWAHAVSRSGELSLGCLGGSIPILGVLMRAESPRFSLWFFSFVWGKRGTRGQLVFLSR